MTKIIAGMLLILRFTAIFLLRKVIRKQIELLRRPIEAEVWDFRRRLHYMTIALFLGNFVPIVLDSLILLKAFGLAEFVRTSPVIVTYAVSNAVTALIAVYMIYKMYDLANQTKEVDELERARLSAKKPKK